MDKSMENDVGRIRQEEIAEGAANPNADPAIKGDYDTLDRLRNILIILNGGLLIIIPGVAWFLTRRTLADLLRIHNQQNQFVSDVAHELRTPLSILSGEMEVALMEKRASSDYQQIFTSSKQETDSLIALVENLLFLARADYRTQTRYFERVDITDTIGGVIASLQVVSSKKQIDLHFQPETELTFVLGQATMLRRLFLNIIQNAIIYTPTGGNVWISLSASKKYVQIEVKDSGIGISSQDQKKIFDRFYRADASRSQTKGYGLGLAICKSIVELHYGKIFVRSTLGQGSIFAIILPRIKS
jgi:signal transduction histidine kinase